MEQSNHISKWRLMRGEWITVALCLAVAAAWAFQNFIFIEFSKPSSPIWLPPAAAILGALGIIMLSNGTERLGKVLFMTGLLLMVWAANKIIFDLLTMMGTVGDPATGKIASVDWPGTITRASAFAAALALARVALKTPAAGSKPPASWYGYAAFVLALPYPLLRIIWAFGGTPGITRPGDAGEGFEPLIIAIPWVLAAALSLLLVSPRRWKPRRLMLVSGWASTAIVASIGPAAFWSMITMLFSGAGDKGEISAWVFCLFYTSWFLWAIAAFAATRSYQLRSALSPHRPLASSPPRLTEQHQPD